MRLRPRKGSKSHRWLSFSRIEKTSKRKRVGSGRNSTSLSSSCICSKIQSNRCTVRPRKYRSSWPACRSLPLSLRFSQSTLWMKSRRFLVSDSVVHSVWTFQSKRSMLPLVKSSTFSASKHTTSAMSLTSIICTLRELSQRYRRWMTETPNSSSIYLRQRIDTTVHLRCS